MVFYRISPLAIYTKDSRPAAPSIITPYTNDAYQPCMNWDSEVEKKQQKKKNTHTHKRDSPSPVDSQDPHKARKDKSQALTF